MRIVGTRCAADAATEVPGGNLARHRGFLYDPSDCLVSQKIPPEPDVHVDVIEQVG